MKPYMKTAVLAAELVGAFLFGGCAAALFMRFAGRRYDNRNEIGLHICCPDLNPVMEESEEGCCDD